MTKERRATWMTVAVLAGAFAMVLVQRSGWGPSPAPTAKPDPTPQQTIYSMLDAARSGDASAYLANFTPAMQVAVGVESSLARDLRESSAAIKGVALTEPQAISEREVKLRVEYVFQDRNEARIMYLERSASGWKIARINPAELVQTPVPYGAPVK